MKIFGREIDNYIVYIGTGTFGGIGLCYALYKILKRIAKREQVEAVLAAVVEDVKLPLLLEHDFGDFRTTCSQVDPVASAYLKQLPEHFFQFNETLSNFTSELIRKKKFTRCRNALIIGSTTGRLAFELGRYFREVRGIDYFFARTVTCYKFQNSGEVQFNFPLEGSYRTVGKKAVLKQDDDLDSQDIVDAETLEFKSVEKLLRKKKPVDVVEFSNVDIKEVPLNLGQFQVVFLTDEINELDDPESLLKNVHRYVEAEGLLIVYTDYSWNRTTNQDLGFSKPTIKTSIDLLKFMLRGFFDLLEEKYIPDVVGQSLRSCLVRNVHVTVWERNNRPILP